jgi:Mn2+/Fe2+ NRAMP family transporter
MNFVAWFIILACAATIFAALITVTDVPTMSRALIPLAGKYAGLLFAFGFFNATVFPICESLGFEAGIHFNFKEAPIFHGLFFDYLNCKCFNHPLNSNESLLSILFYSQVIFGVTLPVFVYYMLRITNNPKIIVNM